MPDLIKERNKFPPAHLSIWLGGEYISITDISREAFVNIMSAWLDSEWFSRKHLFSAYDIAKWSFNGQEGAITRSTWERYFDHVKAVSFIGTVEVWDRSPKRAIARLFHDNPEDTRIDSNVLLATFWKDIADLVNLVTNPNKTWDDDIDKKRKKVAFLAMRQFPEAGMIKVPDRIHNNRSQELILMVRKSIPLDMLTQDMIDRAKRKADETREFIYPIANDLWGKYISLLDQSQIEFENAIEELKDSPKKLS
jgi:(p)ppGpp synthase/HD superfamily hydrolase